LEGSQHIKLSELTSRIEGVNKGAFESKTFWVLAEIAGLKYYQEKNYYFFDLVEKGESSNTILVSIKAKEGAPCRSSQSFH